MNTRIERMRLADLKPLSVNARYMTHPQYVALRDDIARDGCLTSVPLVWLDPSDGRCLILSGNHRVHAGIEALGPDAEADVMVIDGPMSMAERVARQLAHNAISGEDDPATLRSLYETIDDVDWRVYAGLDDKTLELLAKVQAPTISPASLDYLTVVLLLLPDERARFEACIDAARAAVKDADSAYAGRLAEYDRLMDALDLAGRSFGVRNAATSLAIMLDVFEAHYADLAAGWLPDEKRQKWVPLATIFGVDEVPPQAARIMQRAVARMVEHDELSDKARWQAIEFWAADHLAGAE